MSLWQNRANALVSSIKKLSLIGPLAFRSDAVKLENFRFEEGEGDNERTRFNLNVILKIRHRRERYCYFYCFFFLTRKGSRLFLLRKLIPLQFANF